ncbi:secreted protein containing Propetide, peptidase C25 [Candidatus Magnetomorum sp. HK-1]|nr:secreted protein containing Propetide, peptidase C25 [Candidatus Magnetomorum sp. HK-1]
MIFYFYRLTLIIIFIVFFSSTISLSKTIIPSVESIHVNSTEIHCKFVLPQYDIMKKQWISHWPMISVSGKPQLPQTGFFIQVPENAEIHINVIDSQQNQLQLSDVDPVPIIKNIDYQSSLWSYQKDLHTYQTDAYYPESIFDIGNTIKWKHTSIARILIRPFQWNPVKQSLTIIEHMTFAIKFTKPISCVRFPSNSEKSEFSSIDQLKSKLILNYEPHLNMKKRSIKKTKKNIISPKLNLYIYDDGIYSLSYDDLLLNNFPVSEYPAANLQLWNQEKQIPLEIQTQTSFLQPGDQIRFYGTAIHSGFTDKNVYQLLWSNENGLRISHTSASAKDSSSSVNIGFQNLLYEQNNPKTFWTGTPGAPDTDYIFWAKLTAPETFSTVFDLPDLASVSTPCHITVTLQGKTNNLHKYKIYINDHLISENIWDKASIHHAGFDVDTSLLKPENNQFQIISALSENVLADVFYINNIKIKYPKYLRAHENIINIALNTFQTNIEITGFTRNRIYGYDISNPCVPQKLTDQNIILSDNFYSVQLYNHSSKQLYVCSDDALLKPEMRLAYSENLKTIENGADYIIIAPDHFLSAINPLIKHYQKKNLHVLTVNPDEIYDTFNGGIINPQAINDFLKYAYNYWNAPHPSYVLMVGDSNMDYLNYFENNKQNDVPVYLSYFDDIGMSPDDNHLVCVEGDDLIPDIIIGRIPGKDVSDITKFIEKRLAYPKTFHTTRQANLFVSDDNQSNTYSNINAKGMEFFPDTMTQNHLQLVINSNVNLFTQQIVEQINQGALITSYVGHGSISNWGGEFFFESSDIKNIQAQAPLSFFLSLNCLSGFFGLPDGYSLSEELILAEHKGAIAVFAPTGLAQVWEIDLLAQEIFSLIQSYPDLSLGEIVTAAKISAYAKGIRDDAIKMFTFMGDPAIQLNIHTRGVVGDADNDGKLSLNDLIIMLGLITGQQKEFCLFPVDVNSNQKVDIDEILFLFQKLID